MASKNKKKSNKLDVLKTKGKGFLNQKASIFADKRTKRSKTRQTQNDSTIKEQLKN